MYECMREFEVISLMGVDQGSVWEILGRMSVMMSSSGMAWVMQRQGVASGMEKLARWEIVEAILKLGYLSLAT